MHSFITKLTKVTKRDLFLEFITYNEILKYIPIYKPFLKRKLTKINNTQVETKDIIYSQIPKLYGISAFKAESNYLDGSTIDTSLVTLPSYEHVQLSFKINNFDTNLIVDSNKYRKSLASNQRKFNAAIISAQKASSNYSL